MKSLALVLLLLCGCQPINRGKFETRCGLIFQGELNTGMPVAGWTEELVQWTENRIIQIFSEKVTDDRFSSERKLCQAFEGNSIWVHPTFSWKNYAGVDVAGESGCLEKLVFVNNQYPNDGTLAHELAHVVQKCTPYLPADPGVDIQHANWHRDNIFSTIDAIRH